MVRSSRENTKDDLAKIYGRLCKWGGCKRAAQFVREAIWLLEGSLRWDGELEFDVPIWDYKGTPDDATFATDREWAESVDDMLLDVKNSCASAPGEPGWHNIFTWLFHLMYMAHYELASEYELGDADWPRNEVFCEPFC